jgi:hypothetical protein
MKDKREAIGIGTLESARSVERRAGENLTSRSLQGGQRPA